MTNSLMNQTKRDRLYPLNGFKPESAKVGYAFLRAQSSSSVQNDHGAPDWRLIKQSKQEMAGA